jgi:hypothetical protein
MEIRGMATPRDEATAVTNIHQKMFLSFNTYPIADASTATDTIPLISTHPHYSF